MSVWSTALGVNVVKNPLVDSPYCIQQNIGFSYPAPGADYLLTESGVFILTEDLQFITTE